AKSSTDWFAADIGGGVSRAGIPSDPNWGRMEIYKYETSPFAMIMPWDGTGQVAEISQDVLDRVGSLAEPRTVHLASAFVLNERLRGMEALASSPPSGPFRERRCAWPEGPATRRVRPPSSMGRRRRPLGHRRSLAHDGASGSAVSGR